MISDTDLLGRGTVKVRLVILQLMYSGTAEKGGRETEGEGRGVYIIKLNSQGGKGTKVHVYLLY